MSMNAYFLGEPAHITVAFTTISGAPEDTTAQFTIRTPDGVETSETVNVVHDGATGSGTYHYDFNTTQAGDHFYRWLAPPGSALVGAAEGQFYVLRSAF